MNKTLSRKDGTPDKSLQEMKEEIQDMMAEMRKRQLQGKKSIAEEEMKLGHTRTRTHTHALVRMHTRKQTHVQGHPFFSHSLSKIQLLRKCIKRSFFSDAGFADSSADIIRGARQKLLKSVSKVLEK